jgi:hypothetical protein
VNVGNFNVLFHNFLDSSDVLSTFVLVFLSFLNSKFFDKSGRGE